MKIKLKDVQKWYANKLNKGTDELDDYDSFCAKVAYDYACVLNENEPVKTMIEYFNRFSETDEPDDMGRWARTAVYKNIRIAWISRLESRDEIIFTVYCHFPTLQNDTANEHKVCYSLDEAKDFIKERWEWFLRAVS